MKIQYSKVVHFFTVVADSDKGLGIIGTSLNQIGKLLPSQLFGAAKLPSYVNVSSGNLMMSSAIFKQIERNFPVELYYFYNSQTSITAAWCLAHKRFKKIPKKVSSRPHDKTAVLLEADGHETIYTLEMDEENGIWLAPICQAERSSLRYDTTLAQWVWWDPKNHITEYYDENGRLMQRLDVSGRATCYEYHDQQEMYRLTAVIGPSGTRYELRKQTIENGYQMLFSFKAEDTQAPQVTHIHTFDTNNRLIKTMILLDNAYNWYEVKYIYHLDQLTSVTQSDGSCLHFGYDTSQVRRLAWFQSGNETAITQFKYLKDSTSGLTQVEMLDAHAGKTIYSLDVQARIAKLECEQGYYSVGEEMFADTTLYSYDTQKRISSITHPNGGIETFRYVGLESLLASRTFPNGQKTEYAYDFINRRYFCCCVTRNDITNRAYITRHIYDYCYQDKQVFLRFEISPEGWVTEYRPDGWGNVESIRHYLNHRFDLSRILPTQVPTLAVMEQWSKNKLSAVSLTEYIYDGRRKAQILLTYQYGQVDQAGKGDKHAPDTRKDRTVRDERGNLLEHIQDLYAPNTSENSVLYPQARTRQMFDGLNRLIKHENAMDEIKTHQYVTNQVITTHANQCVDTVTYSGSMLVTEKQQQVVQQIRTEKYRCNPMGCPLLATLIDGQQLLTYYDRQFRLGYQITATGTINEYRYNKQQRFNTHIQYANRIDLNAYLHSLPISFFPQVLQLQQWMEQQHIPDPAHDRYSYEFFDLSDQLIYIIDAENYIVQTFYDALDRSVVKIAYQAPLSQSDFAKLKKGETLQLPFNARQDRCTRTFYDRDGLMIGEQDARGYVTEYQRNGAGWITHKVQYANSQKIDLSMQDFAQIRPIANVSKDAHTYYFYNHHGLCELEIDAEGYVTEMSYLAGGLLNKKIRHVQNLREVEPNWFSDPSARPARLPLTTHEDAATQYHYDLLGREIAVLEANDNVRSDTIYNNIGKVLSQTQRDVSDAVTTIITGDTFRGVIQQYDGWKQIIQEANAFVTEKLALLENNPNLNPTQKTAAKHQLWSQYSRRHTFDAVGLKVKTVVSVVNDAEFAQGLLKDVTTYYYYDQARRPLVLITLLEEHKTHIQENSYNTFGEIIGTRRYSQSQHSLSPANITGLTGGFLPADLRQILNTLQTSTDEITQQMRNKRGLIHQKIDAEGYVCLYQYDAFKACVWEQLPVAAQQPSLTITHTFDTAGHETATTQIAGSLTITTKREYHHAAGQLTNLIDAAGCQHKTTYDRLARAIKYVTIVDSVAVTDSSIQLDAFARPRTQTDALNHVTQYSYDRPQRTTVVAHAVEGTQETIQTNSFGEVTKHTDGLGNRQTTQHAADGQVLIKTDVFGNVSSNHYNLVGSQLLHQAKNGAQTVYQRNLAGDLIRMITDANGLRYSKTFSRNALGRATQIIDACGVIQHNTYDRRGSLMQQMIDPKAAKLLTEYQYNGQSTCIQMQQGDMTVPKQTQETYQRDGLNRAIGNTWNPQGLNIQHQQHLNASGRVIAEVDPEGNVSRTYYNQREQKRFTIDALGSVKEWNYDLADNCIEIRTYATALSEQQLASLTDQTPLNSLLAMLKPNLLDSRQQLFYDANNRVRFVLDFLWDATKYEESAIVRETRYDSASHEIANILYHMPMDQIKTLTTEQLVVWASKHADPTYDRQIRNILDAAGQKRFVIDAVGVVTEQRFDKSGNVITKVIYANPITANRINTVNWNELTDLYILPLQVDPLRDRAIFMVYNNLDKPLYVVSAEGAVVHYQYDNNQNKIAECHFQQKIAPYPPKDYETLVQQLKSWVTDPKVDSITRFDYNAANQMIAVTDALGHVDRFERDARDNIVNHIDRGGNHWIYTYDAANRCTSEIAPKVKTITAVKWNQDDPGKVDSYQEIVIAATKLNIYDADGNLITVTEGANTAEALIHRTTFDQRKQPIATASYAQADPNKKLTTETIYNAKQLKIAACDQGGAWSFYIYDNVGELLYHIDALGSVIKTERNTAGEIIKEIHYATRIEIQASYQKTGIPLDDLVAQLKVSVEDYIKTYKRDQHGDVILLQVNDASTKAQHENSLIVLGDAALQIRYQYNAFRQWIKKSVLIDAQKNMPTADVLKWFDRDGGLVAECNAAQQVTRFKRDPAGRMIEQHIWAQTPKTDLTLNMSLAELDANHQVDAADQIELYGYDLLGQIITKSRTKVVLQNVQIDLESDLPIVISQPAQTLETHYFYSATQQLISEIDTAGNAYYLYYNACQQKIAETAVPRQSHNAQGETLILVPLKTYDVDVFGKTIIATQYSQGTKVQTSIELQPPKPIAVDVMCDQVTFFVHDDLNRQVGEVQDPITILQPQGEGIAIRTRLNPANQVIAECDADGYTTRHFYDVLGNKRFTIAAEGNVTEWRYSTFNQQRSKRIYADKLSEMQVTVLHDDTTLQMLVELMQNKIDEQNDTVTWYFYDHNGQQVFEIGMLWNVQQHTSVGIVNEKIYNALGKCIQTHLYTQLVELKDISKLTTAQLYVLMQTYNDPIRDRITYYITDPAGRERFIIDAVGAVIEQQYDAFNRMIMRVAYASVAKNLKVLMQLPIEQFAKQLEKSSADRVTYQVFNALGKLEYEVKPKGYEAEAAVIRYAYDQHSNQIAKVQYALCITPAITYTAVVQQVKSLLPQLHEDRVIQYRYDAAKQLRRTIDALQHMDNYLYDIFGNEISHIDRKHAVWQKQFNRVNRNVIEVAPSVAVTSIIIDDAEHLIAQAPSKLAIEKHKIYYKSGTVKQVTLAANTAESRTVIYDYNARANPVTITLPKVMLAAKEPLQNLSNKIIYNSKQLKIAEKNLANYWTYYVYDNQDRLLYQVLPNQSLVKTERNVAGQVTREIRYAQVIEQDLTSYLQTGIPRIVLDNFIATHTDIKQDRYLDYQYDCRGDLIQLQQSEVFYYLPAKVNTHTVFGYGCITTFQQMNAFRECIYQVQSMGNIALHATTKWFDRAGNIAIEINPLLHVKRYQHNAFDEENSRTEYATAIAFPLSPLLTITAIDVILTLLSSVNARRYRKSFDREGNVTEEITLQVITQHLIAEEQQMPLLVDETASDLTVKHGYTPTGKRCVTTYENGQSEYTFYNACDVMIAKTGISLSEQLIPLTYYGVNAHNQTVATRRFHSGTAYTDITLPLPNPITTDDQLDPVELMLFDNRGLVLCQQDANGNVKGFAHTPTGKVARQWVFVTNWHTPIHRDETHFSFDALDKPTEEKLMRDEHLIEKTQAFYNAFGELIGEGPGDGTMPLYHERDRLGNIWRTNAEGGINTIIVRDHLAKETLRLQSATLDLASNTVVSYQSLEAFLHLQIDPVILERTESMRDALGQIVLQTSPAGYHQDVSKPQTIPLQMLVSTRFPEISLLTLTWPIPREQTVSPIFWYWPNGDDKVITQKSLDIKILASEQVCGVDISHLDTDEYAYEINYSGTGTEANTAPLIYQTQGLFQVATSQTQNSQNLVVVVEREDQLYLTGNTLNLTGIELWRGAQKIADIAIQSNLQTPRYQVDLTHYAAGVYAVKPIRNGRIGELSLSFVINTLLPGDQPFTHEFWVSADLKIADQYGELKLSKLPIIYQQKLLEVTCHYETLDGKKYRQTFIVNPTQSGQPYTDPYGNEILYNLRFDNAVEKFVNLSVRLQINDYDYLPLMLNLPYVSQLPITPQKDAMVTFNFGQRHLAYITSVIKLEAIPEITFMDVSQDRYATARNIKALGITTQGFVLDVTGMLPCLYPFKIMLANHLMPLMIGELRLSRGGSLYPSRVIPDESSKLLAQPNRQFGYDAWNNKIWQIDSLGNRTDYTFTVHNQTLTILQPETSLLIGDTQTLMRHRPLTRYGYNICHYLIGTTDPNGHTEGSILDAAGHEVIKILGDGLRSRNQVWNALSLIVQHSDARGEIWKYSHDKNGNLTQITTPLNLVTQHTFNELNIQTSVTDPARSITRYMIGARGDIAARIEPLGQTTRYSRVYDVERKVYIYTETQPDTLAYNGHAHTVDWTLDLNVKNVLIWEKDYFGVLQARVDLSGAVYRLEYDYKGQLVRQMSHGGQHGPMCRLTKYKDDPWKEVRHCGEDAARSSGQVDFYRPDIVANLTQHLEYTWLMGRVVKIEDKSHHKLTEYDYDLEGHRIRVRLWLNGELLRQVASVVNELGVSVSSVDAQMRLETWFDPVGNRRRQQARLQTGYVTPQTLDRWMEYDQADRIVRDGDLQLEYKAGFRVKEIQKKQIRQLTYNKDGLLFSTFLSNGEWSKRIYALSGYVTRLEENRQDGVYVQNLYCNANHWLVQDDLSKGDSVQHASLRSSTNYVNNNLGQVLNQTTTYYGDARGTTDTYKKIYVGYDGRQSSVILGNRSNEDDTNWHISSQMYDGNGSLNAILNGGFEVGNHDNDCEGDWWGWNHPVVLFDVTSDGNVLRKWMLLCPTDDRGAGGNALATTRVWRNEYFYGVNGELLESYTIDGNVEEARKEEINVLFGGQGVKGGKGYAWRGKNSSDELMGRLSELPEAQTGNRSFHVAGVIQQVSQSYPPLLPSKVITQEGESYADLARKWLGDPNYGPMLAESSGAPGMSNLKLRGGQSIVLPQLIGWRDSFNTHRPYQEFLSIMMGNIYPHLTTPMPDKEDDWLDILVGVITTGLAVWLTPYLAPYIQGLTASVVQLAAQTLGMTANTTISTGLATGVMAGLTVAALDGLAVGVGLEKHFSWKKALGVGLSEGMLNYYGSDLDVAFTQLTEMVKPETIANALLVSGKVAVLSELTSMATGSSRHFNMENILLSLAENMLTVSLNKALPGKEMQEARNLLDRVEKGLLESLVKQNVNLENYALQLLGSLARDVVFTEVKRLFAQPKLSVKETEKVASSSSNKPMVTSLPQHKTPSASGVNGHKAYGHHLLNNSQVVAEVRELGMPRITRSVWNENSSVQQIIKATIEEIEDPLNWLDASGKKAVQFNSYFARRAQDFWSEGLRTSKQGWNNAVNNGKDFMHLEIHEESFHRVSENFTQAIKSRFFAQAMPVIDKIGRAAIWLGYVGSADRIVSAKETERTRVIFEEVGQQIGEFGGGILGLPVSFTQALPIVTVPIAIATEVGFISAGGGIGKWMGDGAYTFYEGNIDNLKEFIKK